MNTLAGALTVLMIGASGGRGTLYMNAVNQHPQLTLQGVLVNQTEPSIPDNANPSIYYSLSDALEGEIFDVAIVSLPHGLHHSVTSQLIGAGVKTIIKEKPLAITSSEVADYDRAVDNQSIFPIRTTTQRSILPTFLKGHELIKEIGEIQSFRYEYTFAMDKPTSGWRAKKELAKGGVLLDMGYHALKEIICAFGMPDNGFSATLSCVYDDTLAEGLEDRAEITLNYQGFSGTLVLDRHAEHKDELFEVIGSEGRVQITRDVCVQYDANNDLGVNTFETMGKRDQAEELVRRMIDEEYAQWRNKMYDLDRDTVRLIEAIYHSSEIEPTSDQDT